MAVEVQSLGPRVGHGGWLHSHSADPHSGDLHLDVRSTGTLARGSWTEAHAVSLARPGLALERRAAEKPKQPRPVGPVEAAGVASVAVALLG